MLAGFQPGESVAVFGAGPVGLMAAYSGILRGASRVFVVDRVPERLEAAKKIGCEPIDFSKCDAVKTIIEKNGRMVDRSVDAVGYQATGEGTEEVPNIVIEQCIAVTRPTGGVGVPGLYVPSDPGAPDEKSKQGMMMMSFGKLFEKVCKPPVDSYAILLISTSMCRVFHSVPANATSKSITATSGTLSLQEKLSPASLFLTTSTSTMLHRLTRSLTSGSMDTRKC